MRSTIILESKGKYMIELFLVRGSRKIPQKENKYKANARLYVYHFPLLITKVHDNFML